MRRVSAITLYGNRTHVFVHADDGREGWIERRRIDDAGTVDIATMNRAAKKRAVFLQTPAGRVELAHAVFDAGYYPVEIEDEEGGEVLVVAMWQVRDRDIMGPLPLVFRAARVAGGTVAGWMLRRKVHAAAIESRINTEDPDIVVTVPGVDYEFNAKGEIPALLPPTQTIDMA